MAASLTASIASLVLTLDDPNRDDLDSVIVWGSTTSGFTPGAGNVLYKGKSLTVTIANLTPLTTYYLKYAYISSIDPDDYVISAQLSGVPNKIDGDLIVNGLRGKTLASGIIIDGGATVTAAVSKPTDVNTTTSIYLDDTSDFPPSGAAVILSKNGGVPKTSNIASVTLGDFPHELDDKKIRYTGKTSNSLTGVSGLQYQVFAGDIVAPQPFPSFKLGSYVVGDQINTDDGAKFLFRQTGGSALAISQTRAADVFTYTAGHVLSSGTYYSNLTGVSGLAAFSEAYGSMATIIDLTSTITTVIAATGTVSSLTINAATSFIRPSGGKIILASTTVTGFKRVNYTAYSSTTITLDEPTYLTAATYYIIPLFAINVLGADPYSFVSYANTYNGEWRQTQVSTDVQIADTVLNRLLLKPSYGYGLRVLPPSRGVDFDPALAGAAGILIGKSAGSLHIEMEPLSASDLNVDSMYGTLSAAFHLGIVGGYSNYEGHVLAGYDGLSVRHYQPISTTLRFSGYDAANIDAITYNDTTKTFRFDADGGTGNATIAATNYQFGTTTDTTITRSAAGVIAVEGGVVPKENRANTFTAAQTISTNTGSSNSLNFSATGWGSTVRLGRNGTSGSEVFLSNNWNPNSNAVDVATHGTSYVKIVGDSTGAVGSVSFGTGDAGAAPSERLNISKAGAVAIGSGINGAVTLNIGRNIVGNGGTNGYGSVSGGTVQSDVTGLAGGFSTFIGTAAASFTLTQLDHFRAAPNTFGVGSTVSNQVGFNATALIGATNNYGFLSADTSAITSSKTAYGFYSGVNTATGGGTTYGFYAAGTARNLFSGDLQVFGAGGLGYATGSGGSVTQATSRTTGVTLNKTNGAITLVSAAGSTTFQSFTVTNSTVAATDTVIVSQKSGTDLYEIHVTAVAAGSFKISFRTTSGTTTEQPVFNFSVIKAVTA